MLEYECDEWTEYSCQRSKGARENNSGHLVFDWGMTVCLPEMDIQLVVPREGLRTSICMFQITKRVPQPSEHFLRLLWT